MGEIGEQSRHLDASESRERGGGGRQFIDFCSRVFVSVLLPQIFKCPVRIEMPHCSDVIFSPRVMQIPPRVDRLAVFGDRGELVMLVCKGRLLRDIK